MDGNAGRQGAAEDELKTTSLFERVIVRPMSRMRRPSAQQAPPMVTLELLAQTRIAPPLAQIFPIKNDCPSAARKYALPRSQFHCCDWRNSSKLTRVRRNDTSMRERCDRPTLLLGRIPESRL